ncbi:hypothetical protein LIER_15457 [Lithospermum erythrorhizon]|uniref:Uncharacterized protein n=1 Tax=Lithospermum erythrorhizon TaxID=34254 RepID=A0AAV3Q895_LITER
MQGKKRIEELQKAQKGAFDKFVVKESQVSAFNNDDIENDMVNDVENPIADDENDVDNPTFDDECDLNDVDNPIVDDEPNLNDRYASIPHQPLHEMVSMLCPIASYQWGVGIVEDLPRTAGSKIYAIVLVDYCTKRVEAKPLPR